MEKNNKKPFIFMLMLVAVSIIVGGTIAYYTSNDTFNNEFNTGTYVIQTQENFESPDNWTPGTTTDKTVIATNKGNTPAAVRVKLTPSWVGSDGVTTLPLTDGTNEAAIINFAFDKDYKWEKVGDWYYYIRSLDTNESTSSLLESVTFNPNVNISATHDCVEDQTTHETVCTTETTGYGDATYKLRVDIETCQFDKYREIWNTNIDISKPETVLTGKLMVNPDNGNNSVTYGYNLRKLDVEVLSILDVISIPNTAIGSWDVSAEQNGSVMAWYTDKDNNGKYELYIGQEGGVKANPNSHQAFAWFQNIDRLNMQYLDTSNVTDMSGMFIYSGYSYPEGVGSFEITGHENWDTSKVETMNDLFRYAGRTAAEWKISDISNWNTSKVQTMEYMFLYTAHYAKEFVIGDIGKWDVSNVENMSNMFTQSGYYAEKIYIGNLLNWDTRKVSNMSNMFGACGEHAKIFDIGTLNIYADNISDLFDGTSEINAIVNIRNVPTNYDDAFNAAPSDNGARIIVNYSSSVASVIDDIIGQWHMNATKGDQLD